MQKKIYLISAILLCSLFKLIAQPGLQFPDREVVCGETLTLPITVTDFTDIQGIQFSVNWDISDLSFVSSEATTSLTTVGSATFNTGNIATGQLSFIWFTNNTANAPTLVDGDTIGLVTFTVSGNDFATTDVAFSDTPVFIEATRNNAPIPVNITAGSLTLIDNTLPTLTCPTNQTAMATAGSSMASVTGISANAMDNCGIDSILYQFSGATTGMGLGDASGQFFNVGTTTVTYTIKDFQGNTEQCSFEVLVESGDTIIEPTLFTLISQSATAPCDADDITIDVNVAAFDSVAGLQFSVNWDPSILQYESLDTLQFLNDVGFDFIDLANGRIGYTWFDALTASLPSGSTLFRLHFSPAGGGTSDIGFTSTPTPLEVNVRQNGQFQVLPIDSIALTTGSVTIVDEVPPTIQCPDDVNLLLPNGQVSAAVNGLDPVVDDNCSVASVTYTLSGATVGSGNTTASGTTFNLGTTTITYTVTDGGGNTAECSSTVTLNAPGAIQISAVTGVANCGDTQNRVDITVDSFTNVRGLQFSVEWDPAVFGFDSIANFGIAEISNTNFTLTQTANGQLAFAWIDLSIDGQTLDNGAVLFSIFYTVLGGDGAATNITIGDDPVPREGNVSTTNGNMTVAVIGNNGSITIVDNTPPIIVNAFPDTIFQFLNGDSCNIAAFWTEPSFQDECSANLTLTRSHAPGTIFEKGQQLIIYTATDPAGNTAADSTLLIVADTIGPTLIDCPVDISMASDDNCQATVTWIPPTATDNCSEVTITASHNPGDTFMAGMTTVTYTATDEDGNSATCSFVVTVSGLVPIVFDNFPGNITVNADANQCGVSGIEWAEPTASGGCDNGSPITITSTHQPGDFFPVGATDVIYTATDGGGQVHRDTFTFTVIDNQDLVVTCPTDIEIQADGSVLVDEANFINSVTSDTCGSYTITFNEIQAFDNCSPIVTIQTVGPPSGSLFTFGTTMMEFVVSDTAGTSRVCTFQITVNEMNDLGVTTLDDPNCTGSDLRLTANTLANSSYQWSGPGGFIADVQNPIIPNAMVQNSGEYVLKVGTPNGCTIKDSVMVGVLSAPTIEATGNDLDCSGAGDTIRLSVQETSGIPVDFIWTGPGGFIDSSNTSELIIPNASIVNAGQYVVVGASSNGCTDTDTVVVGLTGIVTAALQTESGRDTFCFGEPFNLAGTAFDGIVTYEWEAPITAGLPLQRDTNVLTVQPTAPGTYTYTFSANLDGGCPSDTAQLTVVIEDGVGSITVSNDGPFVCAPSNQTINLAASVEADVTSFAWTGPNGFSSTLQNPTVTASNAAAGTYILVATAANGCTSTDSTLVEVSVQGVPPNIVLSSGSNNVCEGDALILSTDEIVGATYAWTASNGFTSTDPMIIIPNAMVNDNGVSYGLRVTTADGCESAPATTGPINVLSDPTIVDDQIFNIVNQATTFNVLENDQITVGAPFTVTTISGVNRGTLINNNDGTFTYTPENNFVGMNQIAYEFCYVDCPTLCGMATVSIRTEFDPSQCIVPTFISPNGDGQNDVLFISCVTDPPKQGSELIVWNEWGSEVFRESPYQNNWQGTFEGEDLPDGTYYYVYREDSDDPNPVKGYFTIFR